MSLMCEKEVHLTRIVVLHETRKLFLGLVLRYCLRINFTLFNEPCTELCLFVIQTGGRSVHAPSLLWEIDSLRLADETVLSPL